MFCVAGVTTAGRVPSVTSVCRTPGVFTAPAANPGSAPARRTGGVCCVTKVRRSQSYICISCHFKSQIKPRTDFNVWCWRWTHRKKNCFPERNHIQKSAPCCCSVVKLQCGKVSLIPQLASLKSQEETVIVQDVRNRSQSSVNMLLHCSGYSLQSELFSDHDMDPGRKTCRCCFFFFTAQKSRKISSCVLSLHQRFSTWGSRPQMGVTRWFLGVLSRKNVFFFFKLFYLRQKWHLNFLKQVKENKKSNFEKRSHIYEIKRWILI